jgi:hypothetical protein
MPLVLQSRVTSTLVTSLNSRPNLTRSNSRLGNLPRNFCCHSFEAGGSVVQSCTLINNYNAFTASEGSGRIYSSSRLKDHEIANPHQEFFAGTARGPGDLRMLSTKRYDGKGRKSLMTGRAPVDLAQLCRTSFFEYATCAQFLQVFRNRRSKYDIRAFKRRLTPVPEPYRLRRYRDLTAYAFHTLDTARIASYRAAKSVFPKKPRTDGVVS